MRRIADKSKPSHALGSFSFPNRAWLLLIILAALGLRLIRLDFQPLWWDEGYSVFFATRDLPTLIARTALDIHPPLYYLLLKAWISIMGDGPVELRLLSCIIGVLCVPVLYALVKSLFSSTRIALVSALVLALSPLQIYYSQEVRMWGLLTLLGLGSTLFLVRLIEDSQSGAGRSWLWLGYVFLTAAALYTEYYAAILVGFQIVAVVFEAIRRVRHSTRPASLIRQFAAPLSAWIAVLLLYLPWIVYASFKLFDYVTAKVPHEGYLPLDPATYAAQHLAAFAVGDVTMWKWLSWTSLPIIAVALLGFLTLRRHHNSASAFSPVRFLCLYLCVPLILGYAINLVFPFHPDHYERLLLFAAPALLVLVAAGISWIGSRHAFFGALAIAGIAIISGLSLYDFYTVPRYTDYDYRQLIGEMQRDARPGDAVLAIYPWQIGYLETYYQGAPVSITEAPSDLWVGDVASMKRGLDSMMTAHKRVWLLEYQMLGRIVEDRASAFYRAQQYSLLDTWFGTTRLELYASAKDPENLARSVGFEGGPTLADWAISEDSVPADWSFIPIVLNWNAANGETHLSLRLRDSEGHKWVQDDRGVENGIQRVGLMLPVGMPPGKYDVELVTYSSSGGNLKPLNSPEGKKVSLGSVNLIAPSDGAATVEGFVADFGNGARLVSSEIGQGPFRPADAVPVTLLWQARRKMNADYDIALQVRDDAGNIYGATRAAPAYGVYPTSHWQVNQLVRDPQTLSLRGDAPDGQYQVWAAWVDPAAGTPETVANREGWLRVGTIQVQGRPHYFGAPHPSNAITARFGQIAELVGYDVVKNDRSINMVLYWRAISASQTSYTVFAHVVDSSGQIVGQKDQAPGSGAYPTTTFVKGEYLVDEYDVAVPKGVPQDASIEIGLYDAKTGSRLPVYDSSEHSIGDHLVLPWRVSSP